MSEELTKTKLLPIQGKDMDSIMQNLETGIAELFTSERYQEYLKTMSKFHNYSFNNTLLIAMQRPDATLVTGYRNWQSMGRQVKKGEKGITIIAPAPIKRKKEQTVLDQDQKPVIGPDGKPKTEEVEITLPCFKAITVFDIEQTTGEPIQTLAPEILTAAVEDFDLFLQAIREISPVPIRFDAIEGSANGYYHNLNKEIVIKKDMSQSQTLKTAIHETAHARLHDREIMESQGIEKDRLTKEVEAESVAYCVCSAFELDTSEYSFPYIAGWSSGKEMRELKSSMDVIRKTAGEMIDELIEKIEMMLEQKQEKLLAAVEAAGYRFVKEESNPQHLQFIPDGTHRMQGHLFAKSWNEVERWVEAIIEKGDPIQKERVERVIYPERFEQSFEEMMFTRKECRLSIYHLYENGSGRDQLFAGMEDLQKKGIMVTADQYRCVYSSLYLPNEDMNVIYSIFNDDPPADYKAHSLSVSDVVIMNQNGDMKAYFVDRFGFQELTDFVEERKKILGMENDIQKRDILEQTSCISFYAAECSEFPVLGEVHHDLNLPDALEAYEKIPAERMNGLKSVGFNLQEGSDYDGMMDLMVAGRSQREILDSIPFYKENKLVQEALKRVEQYIEEKSLNVEKTRPKEEKGEIQKTKSQKRREDMSL
ncbi:YodL domain-containing protein [Mediterraneibacter gnavus]|uniref:YodL domain-containing protein n=1 Tax=Mediterraneibacter gnavus TaxID=33038 RepID=UPI0036D42696